MKNNQVLVAPNSSSYSSLLDAAAVGDDWELDQAVLHLAPEFHRLAAAFRPRYCDYPVLEQAARAGALKAAAKFDPLKSKDFAAFAKMVISHAIGDEMDRILRGRLILLHDFKPWEQAKFAPEPVQETTPANLIERAEAGNEVIHTVRSWIEGRPSRQKEYIRLHFFEGHTKAETARWMRISKAAVSKLHAAVIAAGKSGLATLKAELAYC